MQKTSLQYRRLPLLRALNFTHVAHGGRWRELTEARGKVLRRSPWRLHQLGAQRPGEQTFPGWRANSINSRKMT